MKARGILVLLLSIAGPAGGESPQSTASPSVGLIAAETPEISASMAAGARLALSNWGNRSGVHLTLRVTDPPKAWSSASGPAVDMAFEAGVLALLTPPDRSTAHLLAQLGTRAQVPVVSSAQAPTVTGAGSYWVVSVAPSSAPSEEFVRLFRSAEGRDPDRWAILGYDAAAAVAEAVARVGLDRRAVVEAWRGDFVVNGAGGEFGFDRRGRRRQ